MKFVVWGHQVGSINSDDGYDLVNLTAAQNDVPEPTDETFDKIATVMSEVFNNVPRARQMIEAAMNMIVLELNGGSELSGDDEQQQARELIKWMEGLDAALAAVETFNVNEVKK